MRGDRGAGGAARAGHHVQDAGRETRLERQLAEPQRGHRRVARRLEDRRVPGGERRRDLPAGHVHRVVPRDDQPADPDRLLERHVEAGLGDRDRLAVDLVRGAGVVVEHEPDAGDLAAGAGDRLAGVAALELGELLGVLLHELAELGERAATLAGGPVGPALGVLERLLGGLDRAIDVLFATERRRGDRGSGGRVDDLERLAVRRIDGLAADDHLQGRDRGAGPPGRLLLDRHGFATSGGSAAGLGREMCVEKWPPIIRRTPITARRAT